VIGQLLAIVQRYPPLVDGAFVIIAWVAIRLIVEYLHSAGYIEFEFPEWLSLGLIVVIFVISLLYARRVERTKRTRAERAATALLSETDRSA
jgi:predicted tellurium resistance membrane protein TerC